MIPQIGILNDLRRLNVAITRAKKKLIMIGNINFLKENYEPFRKLFTLLEPTEQILNMAELLPSI